MHEKQFGLNHPKVARGASDLALYLRTLGDRNGAAELLRRALAIDIKTFGETHSQTCEDLENLASVSAAPDALELHRRASSCSSGEIAARNFAKVGALLERRGDREGATQAYRQALAREEAASGRVHPRVAVRLNDLALSIEPKPAEPLLRRALAIQQKALGAGDPETGVTLNNLANVLLATERLAEAERLQRQALSILEAALGEGHPRVATSCSNLADVLAAKGDLIGARLLYRRALSIDERVYGANHPEVAVDRENLARVERALKEKQERK